jgi:acrylyl-CoA reductase (NADPH)
MQSAENRIRIWARVVDDLPLDKLDGLTEAISLSDVQNAANDILKGQVRGRLVVDLNA